MDRRLKVSLTGILTVIIGVLLSVPNIMNYFKTLLRGFDAKFGLLNAVLTAVGLTLFLFGLFIISAGLRKLSFWLTILIVFVFIFTVGAVITFRNTVSTDVSETVTEEIKIKADSEGAKMIDIPMGSDTKTIAGILTNEGIINKPQIFTVVSKINGFDGKYQAGTHILKPGLEFNSIMTILTGKPESKKVTIPEGLSYRQIVNTFVKKELATTDKFDYAMKYEKYDYDFVKNMKSSNNREFQLEGYLFPDTYEFAMNASEKTIVSIMLENFNNKITKEHYKRAKELGMSMDEIITLASIIEREANNTKDRRLVSAVFHRRLKSRDLNRLQSCATIQYVFLNKEGKVHEKLTYEDTKIISPYNTYIHPGLPPGPICSPGMDSINAALYPDEDTDYMFFIAGPEGSTKFSKTYQEHLKAMKQYGLAK
ncbi:endolytic transglycosylase MltG [Ruminiclostridium cellulolyticum]|uniref:Endolytic murein transglycosylase n=1 Tax=Ruminiclostridium cellulolyticum (strain ATCC 35319 / DSM 5812 / JCM 6584 / H10) TaxID=394503 RepID=B8I200_RUMCH|nr:endolytic transglycosylase MltG [Ruminiclostridium cellulolyticum]ACL75826.1 aminodeoxychorismate lyase [Ruminiclostridium cellulolyticum H10]